MHANVITWHLDPGESLEQLIREIHQAAGSWPPAGMVDGYVVQAAPDTAITVGIYERADQADALFERLRAACVPLAGRADIVERRSGPTHDYWGPNPTWTENR